MLIGLEEDVGAGKTTRGRSQIGECTILGYPWRDGDILITDRGEVGEAGDILRDVGLGGVDARIPFWQRWDIEEAFDLGAGIDGVGGEGLDLVGG